MWVPPEEKDPIVIHKPTRKRVGYFGAIRLVDGRLIHRREPTSFNGQSCWTFFKYFRKVTAPTRKHTVVILDNARYHHARLHLEWRTKCENRLTFLFLPPYSPELNPIERVWKLARRLCTHNRYFPNLNEIIGSVEGQFNQWRNGSEALCRLCAMN